MSSSKELGKFVSLFLGSLVCSEGFFGKFVSFLGRIGFFLLKHFDDFSLVGGLAGDFLDNLSDEGDSLSGSLAGDPGGGFDGGDDVSFVKSDS